MQQPVVHIMHLCKNPFMIYAAMAEAFFSLYCLVKNISPPKECPLFIPKLAQMHSDSVSMFLKC